jgi:hypothetical protein
MLRLESYHCPRRGGGVFYDDEFYGACDVEFYGACGAYYVFVLSSFYII